MSAPPLAVDSHLIPFLVAAGVFVIFALVVAVVGLRSDKFSGSEGGPRVVMLLAVVLMAGTVGSAIATAQRPSKADVEPLKQVPSSSEQPASSAPEAPGTESATAPKAPSATGPTVRLAADPSGALKYDTDALAAKAG